jgi:hypothetical protein
MHMSHLLSDFTEEDTTLDQRIDRSILDDIKEQDRLNLITEGTSAQGLREGHNTRLEAEPEKSSHDIYSCSLLVYFDYSDCLVCSGFYPTYIFLTFL